MEDLLKRIPGMEVDRDGNVTSQGKDIPKIYVDGKNFSATILKWLPATLLPIWWKAYSSMMI